MAASLQTTGDIPSTNQVFSPQESLDHPFDVTLVVEDGKEFKAHRRVLSKASPFFDKLLKSDMRESNEGIVRLEMLTELCLRDILEFIYTGNVQISTEDDAQELIAMADYLVLPHLKTVATKVLVQKLNVSDAVSTHYFAERYQCKELISATTNFILANFTTVTKTEEFLNLPSKEIKMWISSDEIDVSAEEDVFKIILTWIDREISERKKHFAELFREVRLVYVSRDFLQSDIVTNDLVNDNEGCMDLVSHAIKLIDSKDSDQLSAKPRKSLETPVMVVCVQGSREEDHMLCCYYPHEDRWSRFRGTVPSNTGELISRHGKLYFVSYPIAKLLCYDSFSNCWTSLPYEEKRTVRKIFVRNEDEIYSFLSEDIVCCPECISLRARGIHSPCGKIHHSFIRKYKPESNTWEDVTAFDLGSREAICVVAQDNFVYFLGGYADDRHEVLSKADRYDLSTNRWEKIADLQVPRWYARGVAAYRNIFIVGGVNKDSFPESCEMYDTTTNEWQFIARLRKTPFDHYNPRLLNADSKLYSLICWICAWNRKDRIDCYDPDKNEWNEKTQIPLESLLPMGLANEDYLYVSFSCSMRIFKGSKFLQQASFPGHNEEHSDDGKQKCRIV